MTPSAVEHLKGINELHRLRQNAAGATVGPALLTMSALGV